MMSEKVGGAEGTKLDDEFRDLERVRQPSHITHITLSCFSTTCYSSVQLILVRFWMVNPSQTSVSIIGCLGHLLIAALATRVP